MFCTALSFMPRYSLGSLCQRPLPMTSEALLPRYPKSAQCTPTTEALLPRLKLSTGQPHPGEAM